MDLAAPVTPATPGSAIPFSNSSSSLSSLPTKSKSKSRKGRSKLLYFWSTEEVNKWLKKHFTHHHPQYSDIFMEHCITGRTLVRLTDLKLQMLGVTDAQHREELLRLIMRLKLNTEVYELRALEQKGTPTEPT